MTKHTLDNPILPYDRVTLDSGLRLIHKQVNSAPIVAVSIWVAAGGAHEKPELMGISHFLEHMFFKGTERHPVGKMDELVKSLGGYNNAATSYDYTEYYIVLPSEHFVEAYDVLADAFLNATLPEEEVEREREVIIEEISRKEDSPQSKLYSDFIQGAFRNTRYGMEILGTEETLRSIGRAELLGYYKQYYSPSHTTVSIVGDVSLDKALSVTEQLFAGFERQPDGRRLQGITPVREAHQISLEKDIQQTYFLRGYALPRVMGQPEEYALDVAAAILGEGRGSRLYQLLREKESLVSSFHAFFWTLEGAALFGVEATTLPRDRERVDSIINSEIQRLMDEAVSAEELERAKRLIVTGYAFENEKAISLASTLGRYEVIAEAEDAARYCERIRSVSAEAIQQAVKQYCIPGTDTHAVLVPSKEKK